MAPPSQRPLDLDQLLAQRPRLKALARRLLADEHGAEDVVQEAWVAALERPPRDERALGAWMREVVRTLALRRKRGERRAQAREERVARPEAESVAERLRTQREVVDAVLALDEPLRGTVHARYFEDLPPREIARRQGVSIDTVNDRLKRARRKLRADLGRRLGDGDSVAWSLALLPHAALSPGVAGLIEAQLAGAASLGATTAAPSTSTLLGELVLMKKTLAAVIVLALFAATGVWWSRSDSARPPTAEPALDRPVEARAASPDAGREPVGVAKAGEPRSIDSAREPALASGAPGWDVRGRVSFGSGAPAPGVQVRALLWAGYDTDAPALLDELLTSDEHGRVAWVLSAPEGTVSLRWTPVVEDAVTYSDGAVVPLGEASTRELELFVYPLDATVTGTVRDERGEALVGALVVGATEGTTDGDGRYRVRASSHRAQELVSAQAAGHARKRASVETPAPGGEVECDFSLRPAFVISGRVVDEGGLPVAGAVLSTFFGAGGSATSAANGEFVLDHLDPGHDAHTVSVKADGFVQLTEAVETGAGVPVEREFVLERGARVAGRVIDSHGDGVPAARVCLGFSTDAWNAQWARTRDDGSFEFAYAPRGEQTLWIEREGFAALEHVFEVPAHGDFVGDLTIVLERGRALSGRVVDDEGQGVPDVRVTPRYEGDLLDNAAKTDARGAFELAHVPDAPLELSFYRKRWDRVQQTVERGDVHGLRVVMNPSGRVAGRVIDAATGAPVESFRVRLERVPDPGAPRISLSATWTREGRAFSDPDGRWETSDLELPVGRRIGVEVRAEGYATSELMSATITPEAEHDALVIALTRGRRVTGRVVDASTGAPVVDARVSYAPLPDAGSGMVRAASRGDAWAGYFTRTDAAGEFAFEHVAPQRINIQVEHDDYDMDARSGAHEVRMSGPEPSFLIELGGAGGLTGVALDTNGAPRAGVELTLIGVELRGVSDDILRTATTSHDGRFAFTGLPDGYYRLGEALPLLERGVGIGRGLGVLLRGTAEVVLSPAGDASVRATLVGDGELPEKVELTLMILPESPSPATLTHPVFTVIALGGGFELGELPAGSYTIEPRWREEGRLVHGRPIELDLAAGEAARPTLRLVPR